jgi:hypothetical protein
MTCCHQENLEYHYYSAVWVTTLIVESYYHVYLNMTLTNVDTTCGKKSSRKIIILCRTRDHLLMCIYSGGCLHVPSLNE